MNYLKIIAVVLGFAFVQNNFAQSIIRSNISTFGSQFSNENFAISQTVGQSSNTSVLVNDKMSFRQGFQQPIHSISKKDVNKLLNGTLYPNPNNGIFTLNVELLKGETYEFDIFNYMGAKVYEDMALNNVKKNVNVSHLAAGVYLIRIMENSNTLGEIKFVIY